MLPQTIRGDRTSPDVYKRQALVLDSFKLHFQGFGPLTGEDFFTLVELVLDHLRDGFIVRQVSDDTGHIRIPGKLAGFLAAVAGRCV